MEKCARMWEPGSFKEICLKMYENEPCQKFNVPRNGITRIDVWLHELSELGVKRWFQLKGSEREMWLEDRSIIDMPLNTIYMSQLIRIKLPDGIFQHHRIDHVLTSLIQISVLRINEDSFYVIQPNDYGKLVESIPLIDVYD